MKKLLILTTMALLLSGAAGCRICDWFHRGPAYQQQPCQPVMCTSPCETTVSSCGTCCGATAISPGPETYTTPTPTR